VAETQPLDSTGAIARKISNALATNALPRHIAIEGPIGVGKTTLAQRLAAVLHYPLMLEPVAENPFLDRFYRDGPAYALPTQLFFLLYRARQVADLGSNDLLGSNIVADFLMEKDKLFARITLDPQEFALYEQIWESLRIAPPRPDLVIYLQAPPEVLQQRIQRRGHGFEQDIDIDYLRALADAYTEFFHYYDHGQLLIVNASQIDFANNDQHFELLLDRIVHLDGARQFFNPNPTLL